MRGGRIKREAAGGIQAYLSLIHISPDITMPIIKKRLKRARWSGRILSRRSGSATCCLRPSLLQRPISWEKRLIILWKCIWAICLRCPLILPECLRSACPAAWIQTCLLYTSFLRRQPGNGQESAGRAAAGDCAGVEINRSGSL